MQLFQKEHTQL